MIVFLDSGVVGLLANPNKRGKVIKCEEWLYRLLSKGLYIVSSDICDYEIRRSLILESLRNPRIESIQNLNKLRDIIHFLPLDTEIMYIASQIWAKARYKGQATTSETNLDADVIIAAHWTFLKSQFPSRYIAIATTNVKHLSRFAEAILWETIQI